MVIKKKYLLPGESFFDAEQYLIASLISPEFSAVCFYHEKTGGGMSLVSLREESTTLSDMRKKLEETGVVFEEMMVTIVYTDVSSAYTSSVEQMRDNIASWGCIDIQLSKNQSSGVKVLFKNWDNSIHAQESNAAFDYDMTDTREKSSDTVRVLLVDDSKLVLTILSRTLNEDPNMEVVGTASDAFSATEKILETNPDVIVLDIIMPQINGLNFLKNLVSYYPKPVIIFSTMGKSGGKIETQAYEYGAVDVIDKKILNLRDPQSIETLKEKIKAGASYIVMKKGGD